MERTPPSPSPPVCTCSRYLFPATIPVLSLLLFSILCATAQQRFPPPDFEGGHRLPITSTPEARSLWFAYLDVVVLAASLSVACWLVYRRRSRKGLVGLSLFSLAYFGFWRKGCICAIGSLQNVSLALSDGTYAIPVTVMAFFILPLVFALFSGRTFCAAVCPHGALQDLVLLRPLKVPGWLEQGLSILPFIYLGACVLFAATGSAFMICQYDPFVPVFRMSGRTLMVFCGTILLLLAVFVGRPYCRFLCPYGALLKLAANVSRWRVRVTPNSCTRCRLCESSCPFGALREPQSLETHPASLSKDRRRLAILLFALPLLVVFGGFFGSRIASAAATLHPAVALAQRWLREQDATPKTGVLTPDDLALERARQNPEELLNQSRLIVRKFTIGSWVLSAWVGAVIGIKLISLGMLRQFSDYEPSRGECFACARCFEFCPNELVRRGTLPWVAALESQNVGPIETASAQIQGRV